MSQAGRGENRNALITIASSDRFDETLRQLKLLDGEVVLERRRENARTVHRPAGASSRSRPGENRTCPQAKTVDGR
jgi:hypothetical protein